MLHCSELGAGFLGSLWRRRAAWTPAAEGGGAGKHKNGVRAEGVVDHEFRKAEEERFRLIEAELSRGFKIIKKELNAKLDEFGRQLFQMLLSSSRPANLYRAQQSRSDEVLEEDQDTLCHEDTGEKPQQDMGLVLMSRSELKCLFEKELRAYDVGFSNRIHLPKDETERCMPYLTNMDGICIAMEDLIAAPLRWNSHTDLFQTRILGHTSSAILEDL